MKFTDQLKEATAVNRGSSFFTFQGLKHNTMMVQPWWNIDSKTNFLFTSLKYQLYIEKRPWKAKKPHKICFIITLLSAI